MATLGNILGKLAVRALSDPRGPDVIHSIVVPATWLERGATIELDVPRNLTCARCEGGGCDECERAGALSLRGREDPVQTIQVALPDRRAAAGEGSSISVVLRIPDQGGFSTEPDLPRGLLMLRVSAGVEVDSSVRRLPDELSLAPSMSPDSERQLRAPREVVLRSMFISAVLFVLFLWMLRLSGWL